jgi:hypothetical protein
MSTSTLKQFLVLYLSPANVLASWAGALDKLVRQFSTQHIV